MRRRRNEKGKTMGKILIVAEKPSAGQDIAKVVEATEKHNGYLEGERYIVTWAVGHLIGLKQPQEHDEKYKKWTHPKTSRQGIRHSCHTADAGSKDKDTK